MKGISICILTYNVKFYNRLAVEQIRKLTNLVDYEILVYDNGSTDGSVEWLEAQPDVTLFKGQGNEFRHGHALDFLVRRASYPICCCLCSDAFPVSPEWLTPAMYLSDEVYLAGTHRYNAANDLREYVCPSYLFGWTDWLKNHSFLDSWPNSDTGENMAQACFAQGHTIKTWPARMVDFDGKFEKRLCDYNGWAWHTWLTGRAVNVPKVIPLECQPGYHEYVIEMLREKYKLDY